ncbi:MAG: precorrin-6A reductase [Lachnospiraceae bacterium]
MKQHRILIFAGTTEGRKLTEYLAKKQVSVHVCVATRYGESLIQDYENENISISHERMDADEMKEFMRVYEPDLVVDATHPYASEVTENVRSACQELSISCYRLIREISEASDCVFVENIEEAVEFLKNTKGNILAATGSKELLAYTKIENYQTRVFARVLSVTDVVKKCEELGFVGRNLICMQGPFSVEMNVAMMRQFEISYLVTKESGKTGGFPEKYEAAKQAGASLVVIGRPKEEQGYSLEEMCQLLSETLDLEDRVRAEESRVKRKVSLVGIGTGAKDLLTIEAKNVCEEALLIIGAERMVKAVALPGQDFFLSYRTEEITEYIRKHPEYEKIAVVFSGDIGFYSGAKKLLTALKETSEEEKQMKITLHPGISSVVYFCAKLGISWEDVKLLSMHGKKENIVTAVREHMKVIVLAGSAKGIRKLGNKMCKYGYGNLKVSVGANLSYPNEEIACMAATKLSDYQGDDLAVLYIENPEGGDRSVSAGLKDDLFLRGKVPMTKEEVRSVSLSKLQIHRKSVVYDVGAGTGSVSIEAALLADLGQVYAMEMKEEAVALIRENQYQFGTDNLTVLHGTAPEVMEGLPKPDCVFIGGSRGNLREILWKSVEENPEVRIVINAISLETMTEAISCLKELKEKENLCIEEEEIVQLSVAKSKLVGDYHMMMGQNPIFIISFTSRAKSI